MPEPTPAEDVTTEVFVAHRELLFSVVYGMLGLVAEDVLQETWSAWAARAGAVDGEAIESPRAYLVRIAVNKALARQDAVRRRRETYVGPWLPEPLARPPQLTPPRKEPAMKLTILAPTGATGRHLLTQALAAGHQVTAVVRNPAKLADPSVRTVTADLSHPDPEALAAAVEEADAVLSALGATSSSEPGVAWRGTEAIVAAMRDTASAGWSPSVPPRSAPSPHRPAPTRRSTTRATPS
ncbi:hypothetical protein KCMC57_up28290 [Kitasatospora sp. CMC57]|uniref:NAD(P)-binding domain-containing protein n=1 Tax=Kitasatospora sp. CMC57 TaxID=3231513 RepID=A0AB33JYM8_9ACTN